jgi:hypothetical protein
MGGQMESKLILINPVTNDTFEYKLQGYTEEPIAREHIVINCRA